MRTDAECHAAQAARNAGARSQPRAERRTPTKNQYTKNISPEYIDRCCEYISCLTERFSRTASGKGWKKKSDSWNIETVDGRYYYNTIDAIPFFRALGGTERIQYGYCPAGYLPQTITSISPDGQSKIVRSFIFGVRA